MEILFELLFEFLAEVLLQVVFEVLAEVGLQTLREPFRKVPNPWLASVGYAVFGAVAGGLSLLVFPSLFMASHSARLANLLLAPVAAGAVMAAVGAWRRRRDQELIRLDKFAYGFLFALAMAAVRFSFGD
jgi:hypothetical protein